MSDFTENGTPERSSASYAREIRKLTSNVRGTAEERAQLLIKAKQLLDAAPYSETLVLTYATFLKHLGFPEHSPADFIRPYLPKLMDETKGEELLSAFLSRLRDVGYAEGVVEMADFILQHYPENILANKIKTTGVVENPTELSKSISRISNAYASVDAHEKERLESDARAIYARHPHDPSMINAMANLLFVKDGTGHEGYEFLWNVLDGMPENSSKLGIMQRIVKIQIDRKELDLALATAWEMQALAPDRQEAILAQVSALEAKGSYPAAHDVLLAGIDVIGDANPKMIEQLRFIAKRLANKSGMRPALPATKAPPVVKKPKAPVAQKLSPKPVKASVTPAQFFNAQTRTIEDFVQRLARMPDGESATVFVDAFADSAKTQQAFNRALKAIHKTSKLTVHGIALADRFCAAYPHIAEPIMFKAVFLAASGDQAAAERCYDSILRRFPAHTSALLEKVSALIEREQGEQARFLIKRAREAAPQNMQILFISARIDFHLRRFDAATQTLMPVLQNKHHHEAILLFMACTDQTDNRHRIIKRMLGDNAYEAMVSAGRTWRKNVDNLRYNPDLPNVRFAGGSVFNSIYRPFGINSTATLQMAELPEHLLREVATNTSDRGFIRTAMPAGNGSAGPR